MSTTLADKIALLERLDQREKAVLDYLMEDAEVKVKRIAGEMGFSEVYIRGFLTSLYKKLGVPEGEKDKRGYVIREYSEAYANLYLKVEIPSKPIEPPSIPVEPPRAEPVIVSKPPEPKPVVITPLKEEPVITVSPPPKKSRFGCLRWFYYAYLAYAIGFAVYMLTIFQTGAYWTDTVYAVYFVSLILFTVVVFITSVVVFFKRHA